MNRIDQLVEKLSGAKIDALLLSTDSNVRYISGFTGSESFVLIHPQGNFFITDSRYTEQAEQQCEGFTVIKWDKDAFPLVDVLRKLAVELDIKKLGFEKRYLTFDLYRQLASGMPNVELVPVKSIVEEIRYIKSPDEVEHIRHAASFADQAFTEILGFIKVGMTEKEVALELEYLMRKFGADDRGSNIILVSGVKTSLPHGEPTDKKIEAGDFVTMDFGGEYFGYRSDMTRTIVVGNPTARQKEIYGVVKQAQAAALNMIKDGVIGNEPDNVVRKILDQHGLNELFGHGLGHGVGLDIHEDPFMNRKCQQVIQAGCVITVEPGVYLPGWGGVRIEDTILVLEDGVEILTTSPKELIVI